ncbi:hypothetical protein HOG48_01165 [Candidatus Peregrinibacteria bacterium]|jgi:hypothetical protein|nr:hypothetical protein [Candidatus Peregrinibacteria bacterium]
MFGKQLSWQDAGAPSNRRSVVARNARIRHTHGEGGVEVELPIGSTLSGQDNSCGLITFTVDSTRIDMGKAVVPVELRDGKGEIQYGETTVRKPVEVDRRAGQGNLKITFPPGTRIEVTEKHANAVTLQVRGQIRMSMSSSLFPAAGIRCS